VVDATAPAVATLILGGKAASSPIQAVRSARRRAIRMALRQTLL
jgi:hypothetical protein